MSRHSAGGESAISQQGDIEAATKESQGQSDKPGDKQKARDDVLAALNKDIKQKKEDAEKRNGLIGQNVPENSGQTKTTGGKKEVRWLSLISWH